MPRRLNYVIQETSVGSHSFIVQRHDLRGDFTFSSLNPQCTRVHGVGGALVHYCACARALVR
jgi:hypothetical protein